MTELDLIPIHRDGLPSQPIDDLPEIAHEICTMMATLYEASGFIPPWIGYLAIHQSQTIGTCAFKSVPVDGRVEIAYFTFPEFEGRGFATAMASRLIEIARETDSEVLVFAQTLPEVNASNAILKKLGFAFEGAVIHPDDGEVWEWHLKKSD